MIYSVSDTFDLDMGVKGELNGIPKTTVLTWLTAGFSSTKPP